MKQHKIRLYPLGKEITVNDKTPLIDLLHEYGIEFPCGGKGTCGKCRVSLLEGEIEISEKHRQTLDRLHLSSDSRLACMSHCTDSITLQVEQFDHLILAERPNLNLNLKVDLALLSIWEPRPSSLSW